MANEKQAGANDALYEVFRQRAVSGVERWQEISLDELGQLGFPYRAFGCTKLKDCIAEQCDDIASIRRKTVHLHPQEIERVKDALLSNQDDHDTGTAIPGSGVPCIRALADSQDGHVAAAFGAIKGDEVGGGAEPENAETALAKRLLLSPLAVGSMALEKDDGAAEQAETLLCLVLRAWTSYPLRTEELKASSVDDLLHELPQLGSDNVAIALVHAVRHSRGRTMDPKPGTQKLAHNLASELKKIAGRVSLSEPGRGYRSAMQRLDALATRLGELRDGFFSASRDFCAENSLRDASELSVQLVRAARAYSPFALPEEREAINTHITKREAVVGGPLRRFCDACAKRDTKSVAQEADEIRATVSTLDAIVATAVEGDAVSVFVVPLVARVEAIVAEGTKNIAALAQPKIVLLDDEVKVDLASTEVSFLIQIRNDGPGYASDIVTALAEESPFSLEAVRERGSSTRDLAAFNLVDGAEQIVELVLRRDEDVTDGTALALRWTCGTASGTTANFSGKVVVRQQRKSPDWTSLNRRPPYTPRMPIEDPGKLFGRGDALEELCSSARSRQSTFITGQKRVGKTSVLNVVQRLLAEEEDIVVAFLHRGAIQDGDQGSIAHRIANQLAAGLNMGSSGFPSVPEEPYFGAFLGDGLVDYFQQLKACSPNTRFLVGVRQIVGE